MKLTFQKEMIQKKICLSATKPGDLVDLTRRKASAFSGLTSGVKARQRAFTLIELLVVIAIIAILAAMLLPVLDRAKQMGWKANCIDNFKQLQICYRMYVDDNNDYLPINLLGGVGSSWLSYTGGGNNGAQYDYNTWTIRTGALYPFNQNAKIYVCPANTYMLKVQSGAGSGQTNDFGAFLKLNSFVPQMRTCSIEYSMGGPQPISQGGYTWTTYQKFNQLQATRVASKIVFVDEASGSIDDGAFAMYAMNTQKEWWNIPTSRHLGGCVFGFADGHVEYWKWHGTTVPGSYWQTQGAGTGGTAMPDPGISSADSSDDLARVQAGGPQYP